MFKRGAMSIIVVIFIYLFIFTWFVVQISLLES